MIDRKGRLARPMGPMVLVAALLLCLPLVELRAESAPDDLRATLFRNAERALEAANTATASVLAPRSYGRGADLFRRAETTFASGGNIESIQRNLAQAEDQFRFAAAAAATATQVFEAELRARQRAQFAGASRYAEADWARAEEALANAAERLERGREEAARTAGARATALYETAELAAIKANYLQQTRDVLRRADELRARRHAPLAYQRATDLLAEAEAALNEDRYDTDRPRNLGRMAEQAAWQALYVAQLERGIRSGDTTLEQIVVDWEGAMGSIADALEVPVQFDGGPTQAVATINRAVSVLHAELADLRQGLADREAQIAGLEQELGGKTESLERVNQLLARQEQQRARIARVETMFGIQEANVVRQGDSVILRLIGLNFASGSSTLGSEQQALLAKVRDAIAEFPESTLVIEGHTDSFGSDTANQQLSQERAESVMQYLIRNASIAPTRATALGYGESRPVASNETADGRRRNRRIDIVIHPRW